jgi:hypothetical protein
MGLGGIDVEVNRKTQRKHANPRGRAEEPRVLALLALEALAAYAASGLVASGEHMHEDLALRLANVANKDAW